MSRNCTPPPHGGSLLPNTPSTPRLGFEDNYEPYNLRTSARISQRALLTTPPRKNIRSKKAFTTSSSGASSSPLSPEPAPKTVRRTTTTTTQSLRFDNLPTSSTPGKMSKIDRPAAIRNGMLPTPDKTPKSHSAATAPVIGSIARNLFPVRVDNVDELMPKKGRNRKYKGFTLDEAEETPIQIYTDSHDRVPEADLSADNPFYGPATAQLSGKRIGNKRRKVMIPGEGEQSIEEVQRREDGLLYVFRGKKIFRKFTDHDEDEEVVDDDDEVALSTSTTHSRRMTRSAVKPRLLFPSASRTQRSELTEDEEEAVTDIETDHEDMVTPKEQLIEVATPKAPKFAPASPPTTARRTRSKDVPMVDKSDAASQSSNGSSISPFDGWQRTKRVDKKRSGSPMAKKVSKKVRG